MSSESEADYLVDRRRLRGRISFWRVVAFAAAIAAIVAIGLKLAGGPATLALRGQHIARIAISGIITGSEQTLRLIKDAGDSTSVSAIVLAIDSPGGTTTGSEKIYEEIRIAAAKKPVVAVVGTLAASGAYIAALGADYVVARGNSLVGSIGVLFQYPNVAKLLDTVGVKMEEVKSSPLKAAPNGFETTTPEARAALTALVVDSFDWFKGLVKDRRKMSDAELAVVADGRVFTARQGLPLKLIDKIGGEREAVAWLEGEKGVAKNLPVTTHEPDNGFKRLGLLNSVAGLADWGGMPVFAHLLRQAGGAADAKSLDGLVVIWQAAQ